MKPILNELNKIAFLIQPIFYTLLYLSITAVAVGCILLLIRKILDKKISPNWKYAMWICLILALVIPFRIQSNLSLMGSTYIEQIKDISYREQYDQAKSQLKTELEVGGTFENEHSTEAFLSATTKNLFTKSLIFDVVVPLVGLCGTIILLLFMLVGTIKLRRKIPDVGIVDYSRYYRLLNKYKKTLKINRNIEIVVQNTIKTPALFGLFHAKILLPSYVEAMSDENIEYILLHELAHYKRCDMWVNYLLLALQAIYWFNPFTWLFFKFIRQDLELACDAYVLKFVDKEGHKGYSLSLIQVLQQYSNSSFVPKLLCMVDNQSNLKRRIKMIKLNEVFKKKKLIIAICSIIIIGIVGVLFLTTSASKEIPSLYLYTENSGSAEAIRGGYSWDYGTSQEIADAPSANQMKYSKNNTLYLQKGTQIILSNQKLKSDKRNKFSVEGLGYYAKDGSENSIKMDSTSYINGDLYINAPEIDGEYIFDIVLKYKRGRVNYGVKMVVAGGLSQVGKLFENKTLYVGDNSKVGGILNNLSFPGNLVGKGFELHTDKQPYGITANFTTDTDTLKTYDNENKQDNFKKNAIIMLSLIDNVENIKFNITDGKSRVGLHYNRAMANELVGKDVREYTKTQEGLIELIAQLSSKLQSEFYIPSELNSKDTKNEITIDAANSSDTNMTPEAIANKVEEKIKKIMSSPKESSNPYDYIKANQTEYDEILKMGELGLNYMLSEFEKGKQTGLKGHIMKALCTDILGDRIEKSDKLYGTAQEWYDNLVILDKVVIAK